MRNAFFEELLTLYQNDNRIYFLTADLGFKLFDPLCEASQERVVNVGIRESAMAGMAAGLAKAGMIPFIYSIAPFVTLRCLEQIKIGFSYNRLPAVIVGVGSGYTYGHNGPTHHGIEDIAVLRAIPGIEIQTPADAADVRAFMQTVPNISAPVYLRLCRNGEPDIHNGQQATPHAPYVTKGDGAGCIISCGTISASVLDARKAITGPAPSIIHLPAIKPFPEETILSLITNGPVLTVEEHVLPGGLGERMARALLHNGKNVPFKSLGIGEAYPDRSYDRQELLRLAGIDADAIARNYNELAKSN